MNSNLSVLELRARLEKPARERSLIDIGFARFSRIPPDGISLRRSERSSRDTSRHLELPDRRRESVARRETTMTRRTKRKAVRYAPIPRTSARCRTGRSIRLDPVSRWTGPKDRRRIDGRRPSAACLARVASLFATHRYLDRSAGRCLRDWLLRLPRRRRESHGSTVRFKRRSPQTTRKVNEGFSTRIRKRVPRNCRCLANDRGPSCYRENSCGPPRTDWTGSDRSACDPRARFSSTT